MDDQRLLSAKDVADYLGVSTATVRRMAGRKEIPEPIRLSARVVRWDRAGIDRYLDRFAVPYDDPDEALARGERREDRKAHAR